MTNEWQAGMLKAARIERLREAEERLAGERKVIDYLRETGRDGAAERASKNITKMAETVAKYRAELGVAA